MLKEKYILEVFSKKDLDQNGTPLLMEYVVSMYYYKNGKRKHCGKRFMIKHYLTKAAALKDAIAYRNKMLPILDRRSKLKPDEKETYTVGELYAMTPKYFPRTQGTYTKNDKVYNVYIKKYCDTKDIQEIEIEDIQETLKNCAARCVQQQVRNVKTDWHRIFQVAILKDIPVKDLTQLIDTPVSNKVTERATSEQNITEEDFQTFCEYMGKYGGYLPWEDEKIYNRNILLLMLKFMRVTGMRPQEAKAVHRSDISFNKTTYYDRDSQQDIPIDVALVSVVRSIGSSFTEKLTEKQTKTAQSKRVLPVFNEGIAVIKETLEYSKYERLFSDYNGDPFDTDFVSDYLYRVSKACGIKVYAGLMRKAFSADNYRRKTNPAAVKKMMGHKNENMSVNWYATAADEEIVEAMLNREYKK